MFNKYSTCINSEFRDENEEEEEIDYSSFSIKHHPKKKPLRIIKITEIIEINDDIDDDESKISKTNRSRNCHHICEICKLLENPEKSFTSTSNNNNTTNKKVTIKITGRSRSSSVDLNEAIAENINSNGGQNLLLFRKGLQPDYRDVILASIQPKTT